MTLRITGPKLRGTASALSIGVAALVLAGCSSMGSFGSDPTVTNSTARSGGAVVGQAMPAFLPPANVGGGGMFAASNQPAIIDRTTASPAGMQTAVISQDLPALQSSSVTSTQAMPAQTAIATTASPPLTQPATSSAPQLGVVQGDTYTHTIASGESLYTIARRYDVSATDIIAANNISAPDRIVVGQSLVIPGRPDLLAQRSQQPQQVASANSNQTLTTPSGTPATTATPAAVPAPQAQAPSQEPTQVASLPSQSAPAATQPAAASSGDKFRWPLSGRVITDFAASRGTGINIESPEGTAVRAAENGEVIYVGNAVEGYGNLILIKHDNGYVSAYAHLANISVSKGATVARGDSIGTVGMTGSVNRPQLHFELRRGATPVDPMPLLAG
ncbi:peptidoglycan DD-metalloendopeptidase family protein [Pelagibacterium lacus]|uniref:LysM peptidoglycan-binding domain-containing protein n=1 Tax=Pelagibacterium lacus TaxID=2282655 RepID=A0A369WB41_9HYPH|nr:peptidoglycan DD-metalloendopeptidase family protein [Pelagibacterium lacus]RDE09301.1 LysM peptidoglycan-binding domain-containing protein [Pelagibacterium lacus]